MFSNGQVVAATAGSTNIIDLGVPGTVLNGPAALRRDIGKGTKIPIWVQINDAADDAADTLIVRLQVDNDVAFGSPKTIAVSPTLTGGAAGTRILLDRVAQGADERYMRLHYTVTGDTPDYVITAGIVAADQQSDSVAGGW
jgi:hypothetical protein